MSLGTFPVCEIWDCKYGLGHKGLNPAGLKWEARPLIWNAFWGKIWVFTWLITLFEDCCPGSQKEGPVAPVSVQDQKGERPGSRSRANSNSVCCLLVAPSCQAQDKREIPTVCPSGACRSITVSQKPTSHKSKTNHWALSLPIPILSKHSPMQSK